MQQAIALILVLSSASFAYTFTKRRGGARLDALHSALRTLLECLGAASVFLAINVAIGFVLILVIRSITPIFVSLYLLNDLLLIVLSALEGFVFQLWWRETSIAAG